MRATLSRFFEILMRRSKEWHCTIRGPTGTEFEGGLYHFRILLPSEYPFRPPSILMLTPNGRFELNTKARPLISIVTGARSLTYPRSVSALPVVRSGFYDEKPHFVLSIDFKQTTKNHGSLRGASEPVARLHQSSVIQL